VIIGDPQQLRNVSSIKGSKEHELARNENAIGLLSRYSYCTKSLFNCAAEKCNELGRKMFFLAEHYRSHPKIVEFSNITYYKRGLIIRTSPENQQDKPFIWHHVDSKVDRRRGSLLNEQDANVVADKVAEFANLVNNEWTIGVITPYIRQRNHIEYLLRKEGSLDRLGNRLKVGSVHTFQGSEADIIIFSPVVADDADIKAAEWISNEEGLLNVALTRARKILHIVGNKKYCEQVQGPLGDLAKFVNQISGEQRHKPEDSTVRNTVREMLQELKHWYQEEWPEIDGGYNYRLDFVVIGISGTKYDIEIDGRQHLSAEAIIEDRTRDNFLKEKPRCYQIIRIRAVTVERYPDAVRAVLSRLV